MIRLLPAVISPVLVVVIASGRYQYVKKTNGLIYFETPSHYFPAVSNLNGASSRAASYRITIINRSNVAATGVMVGHRWLPEYHQIVPHVKHEIVRQEDGMALISFARLPARSEISIGYLTIGEHVGNFIDFVKSDKGFAKFPRVYTEIVSPIWMKVLVGCVLFVGLTTCVYWLLLLMGAVLSRTA